MCFPDTKCRNERHLAAVFYSKTGAFEVIHGLLDRLMQMLAIPYIGAGKEGEMTRLMQMLAIPHIGAGKECGAMTKNGYQIRQKDGKTIFKLNFYPFSDPTFFNGRCAEVLYAGKSVGTFGVLHPEVLIKFGLVNPCSALEINIEPFL